MNLQTTTPTQRATYQDVIDAPAHMVAELIDGRLWLRRSPPRAAHAITQLLVRIASPFDLGEPGGWVILFRPELHLGEDVLVPDLAGWRRERLPTLPEEIGITVAPDWVCEGLSPSTRTFDLTDKRALYAARGVASLWLVDPAARTLEAFVLRDGGWMLDATLRDDAEVRLAPFEVAGWSLAALWAA